MCVCVSVCVLHYNYFFHLFFPSPLKRGLSWGVYRRDIGGWTIFKSYYGDGNVCYDYLIPPPVCMCIYLGKELCSYCLVSKSTIIHFYYYLFQKQTAFEIMNIYCINHFCIKLIRDFYASIWEAVFFCLACSPFQFFFRVCVCVCMCVCVNLTTYSI